MQFLWPARPAFFSRMYRSFTRLPKAAQGLLTLALVVGLAERIGWGVARRLQWTTGEAANVAISLAQGHGFSDAFFVGQGPTAHLLPIPPAIAGLVYLVLGIHTHAAEAVLCAWSIGVSFGSYLLLYDTFGRLGTPRWSRLGGLSLLLVLPIYTTNETFEWRIWDGGLGLLIGNLFLNLLLRAEQEERPRWFGIWLALLPALAFFVNPPMGLCAYSVWALYLLHNRPTPREISGAGVAALCAMLLLIGPWTLRNWERMGHFIPLRDDLGLELAVANYPAALQNGDRDLMFLNRLKAIQPYIHPPAQRAMQAAGGEVEYSQQLGRTAKAWIAAHPRDFFTLCARHLVDMAMPGAWIFHAGHGVFLPAFRSCVSRAAACLGALALLLALARRDRRFLYLLPYVAVPILIYMPFQPVIRYCWLLYPLEIMLAADLIGRWLSTARDRLLHVPDERLARAEWAVPVR